jgi:outer membrane protein
MKNTNYIISGILGIAIIILFILQFTCQKNGSKDEVCTETDSVCVQLPIAYVDLDSLLTNFHFYNNLINNYENKLSERNGQLNAKYQNFQKEMLNYQQKAQNNAFLTRERMEQEEADLMRKRDALEKQAQQAEQELALENKLIQQQLSDTLSIAIKAFNEPQKYQMIFTRMGNSNILYADKTYDITKVVTEFLNNRYPETGKE